MKTRSYKELNRLITFKKRFDYLKLKSRIGESTFGFDRWLNQAIYHSAEWRDIRERVIIRDNGCDLGVPNYEITDQIFVHHINPVTKDELIGGDPIVFDLDNLICTSRRTHRAIHFGDESLLPKPLVDRRHGDTTLWRR